MLRKVSLLLIVAMLFVSHSTLLADQSSEISAEGTLFENSYSENNELKAEKTSEVEIIIKNLILTDNRIKINGKIGDEKNFNIVGDVNEGSIDNIEEKSNKLNVMNINVLDEFIVMYLGDNDNVYKLKIDYENQGENLFFNRYWYQEYLEPEITSEEPMSIFTYNRNYYRTYQRTYTIYSDSYTEELNLLINFNWPEALWASGAGDLFTSKIQIRSKYTHVSEYNGSNYTVSGSSLEVAGANLRHGTDKGQYVKDISTSFVGTTYSGGGTSLGYSLGIPNTPLSINYNPPYSTTITQSDNGFYSFNYYGNDVSQQFNIDWDPYKYHLVNNNDYFEARSRIQTDKSYADIGTRNRLKIEWQYEIVSSGINHGHAVPSYNEVDTFSNTLYYDLVD